ncbi:MAG: protein-L-isoaspartate(D-aspartate) O-methyltransferase [Candidatus Krumholzibacteriota bacterium]|nr:protein-L-isoaspartate(D-aspartate) O-methyltransferase [Candidatus Krumholzibacteriota bacterium]
MTGTNDSNRAKREEMVDSQIAARGIEDPGVLDAMRTVPRELFVKGEHSDNAYFDTPLPIGRGQTISQPYIVAYMTERLEIKSDDRVLEIGTGSGYQTAILAHLAEHVYTVEIVSDLARRARENLEKGGYTNISYRIGDGSLGWEEEAPFDAVIITAAPVKIPEKIIEQIGPGGRIVAPVGAFSQKLYRITRKHEDLVEEELIGVRFVPMTGGRDSDS